MALSVRCDETDVKPLTHTSSEWTVIPSKRPFFPVVLFGSLGPFSPFDKEQQVNSSNTYKKGPLSSRSHFRRTVVVSLEETNYFFLLLLLLSSGVFDCELGGFVSQMYDYGREEALNKAGGGERGLFPTAGMIFSLVSSSDPPGTTGKRADKMEEETSKARSPLFPPCLLAHLGFSLGLHLARAASLSLSLFPTFFSLPGLGFGGKEISFILVRFTSLSLLE